LTLLLASLYLIYKLVYAIGSIGEFVEYYWEDTRLEVIYLLILYLFIAMPLIFFFSRNVFRKSNQTYST
jgi:O-antigen ligase